MSHVSEGLGYRRGVKGALASLVLLVAMLLVILAGTDSGWPWIGVLCLGAASTACAIVAIGGALTNKRLEGGRRLLILLIALPVVIAFALAVIAVVNDFGSFE
jgi:hypothetical protein